MDKGTTQGSKPVSTADVGFMAIWRMPAVKANTGHSSHASIYTQIHDGLFTMPVAIGQRAVGWPSHEVQAITAARIAGKSDDQIRELVKQLHSARCADTGEPFQPTWLDRSAKIKTLASKRVRSSAQTAA